MWLQATPLETHCRLVNFWVAMYYIRIYYLIWTCIIVEYSVVRLPTGNRRCPRTASCRMSWFSTVRLSALFSTELPACCLHLEPTPWLPFWHFLPYCCLQPAIANLVANQPGPRCWQAIFVCKSLLYMPVTVSSVVLAVAAVSSYGSDQQTGMSTNQENLVVFITMCTEPCLRSHRCLRCTSQCRPISRLVPPAPQASRPEAHGSKCHFKRSLNCWKADSVGDCVGNHSMAYQGGYQEFRLKCHRKQCWSTRVSS